MTQETYCVNCGHRFFDDPDVIPRTACPDCGDTRRSFSVSVESHDSIDVTAYVEVIRGIKHKADRQLNWDELIPVLARTEYSVIERTLAGDAPKDFIRLTEDGKKKIGLENLSSDYIAKVGDKKYPIESITEHLNTRLAQLLGIRAAQTALCVLAGQVRLLSNYFLQDNEELIHGIEVLEKKFGEEYVKNIAEKHSERSYYTFQIILSAIEEFFPESAGGLVEEFIRMLTYDALIGLQDRHPTNWGLIRSIENIAAPRFAPLYDNARSLFWNSDENEIQKLLIDEQMMNSYIQRSMPVMAIEGVAKANHFELLQTITRDSTFKQIVDSTLSSFSLDKVKNAISIEFSQLMSTERIQAILECLERRHECLRNAV